MKRYENVVDTESAYATRDLDEKLARYGRNGFKLVSTEMAKNRYGTMIMYLFFTKEIED